MLDRKIKQIILNEFFFYNQPNNPEQLAMWVDELKKFPPEQVHKAYVKLRNTCSRVPMPGQVKNIIYNYPSGDEAWSMLPMSEDDNAIWCEPMRTAWSQCRDLRNSGDEMAARMAFKSSYETIVLDFKYNNSNPKWEITRGSNKTNYDELLKKGVERGWLSEDTAKKWSPELALPNINQKQIEGPKETFTPEVMEDNLKRLKDIFNAKKV